MSELMDYGAYIIDLSNAMLDHPESLNDQQGQRIQMIHRRAVDFVTEFLQHENASADRLLEYLNHDAQTPLRIILGNSQMLLSGNCGELAVDYQEAVQEIYDCVFAIVEEVQQMRLDLQNFMESIGMLE